MRDLSPWCKAFLALVAFSIAGSLFSKLSGLSAGWVAPGAAALTLLTGFIAILVPTAGNRWAVPGVCGVLALGSLSELLGIYIGIPFGSYRYTSAWWPVVLLPGARYFPLLLPLAWFLVAGGSYLVACRYSSRFAVPFGALLATLIDLLMEPVMAGRLVYWRWIDHGPLPGGAPWLNLAGWLGTSLAASAILSWTWQRAGCEAKEPAWVLGAYVLLVLALGAIA